jgi:hypothetical protein
MGDLRNIFFGRSEGNNVPFKGSKITLPKREIINFDNLMEKLDQQHEEAGSPLL